MGFFKDVKFSIDGVECPISEPVDRDARYVYYSKKAGRHTIKYEVATHVSSGRIIWISGGVPGSYHDKRLFNNLGFVDYLPEGERGLADKGYEGAGGILITPLKAIRYPACGNPNPTLSLEEKLYNRCIGAIRIETERLNGRLKRFNFLNHGRTRDRLLHRLYFIVIANLVNIWLEVCPLRKKLHPLLKDCSIFTPERALNRE